MPAAFSLLSLAALLCAPPVGEDEVVAPDRVELASGKTLEGRVVFEDAQRLVLRVKTAEHDVALADVQSVRAALRELPRALDRIDAVVPVNTEEFLRLADELREVNLPCEAEVLLWWVLALDAENDGAHERLGHRRVGGEWRVPFRKRWKPLADVALERADWGDEWSFATTHFELRTNLGLLDAVRIAFDLERAYRAIYSVLGAPIELYDLTEPLAVQVHADDVSYPEPRGGRAGYFSTDENRVYLNASAGYSPSSLVHEVTHQVFYNAAGKSDVQPWLNEGLAEYMEGAAVDRNGRIAPVANGILRFLFELHARAEKPDKLSRVLSLDQGSFLRSSFGMSYAQSYTLVHFCLHGDDGAYRAGFHAYLREALNGKASPTRFKKALGIRERDFDQAWLAYVKARAGS